MFKLVLAALMCICLANISTAEKNETKGGFLQHYGVGYYGWNYPYSNYYYSWYNLYPNHFAAATVHAPACNVCPSQCAGTCGLWGSLYACQYSTCPILGNPCNSVNCAKGLYLHAYPFDSNRYIQCDITPGRQFIRTCPHSLVFDPRFGVCNYPTGVVQYYNHYASAVLYGK